MVNPNPCFVCVHPQLNFFALDIHNLNFEILRHVGSGF